MADEINAPAFQFISGGNLPTGSTEAEKFLPAANRTTAVADALSRMDRDRPRAVTYVFNGAGSGAFDLSGATSYVDAESSVLAVHYPWVMGEDRLLDFDDWDVLQNGVALDTLYLYDREPAAGEQVLVEFTAPWTEATVPASLKYKVAKLAAANMCRMIAARMAQSNDNSINVDTFGRNTAAGDWLRMAKDFEAQYSEALGLSKTSEVKAACVEFQALPNEGHNYGRLHPYAEDQ